MPAHSHQTYLTADIKQILGREVQTIVEAGAHWGDTALGYLEAFPEARIFAYEAEAANYDRGKTALRPFGDRVRLAQAALADVDGVVRLQVNSHHGTHSLLGIGEQRYWAAHVEAVQETPVRSERLDTLMQRERIEHVDLLHMDIQGGEVMLLQGAERALRERRISLIYTEVEFYELYRGQPLFWDLAQHLRGYGYQFYGLYDPYYHEANPAVLSWSDALFVSPDYLQLPEHARPVSPGRSAADPAAPR